jgi:hypothetical protein
MDYFVMSWKQKTNLKTIDYCSNDMKTKQKR